MGYDSIMIRLGVQGLWYIFIVWDLSIPHAASTPNLGFRSWLWRCRVLQLSCYEVRFKSLGVFLYVYELLRHEV